MALITVRIDDLVFDESLYPRKTVNTSHVRALIDAVSTGSRLPPIVIDQKNRIVDGKHRCECYRHLYGNDGSIEAEQITYESEADVLLAAAEYNERHGLRLEAFECTDVAIRLTNMRVPSAKIALALHVPEQRVERILLVKTAISPGTQEVRIPLKRSMSQLAGRHLTDLEQVANASAPGTSWAVHIQQLNKALRAGLGVHWGLEVQEQLEATLELLLAVRSRQVA
jgi:hypothetical protein